MQDNLRRRFGNAMLWYTCLVNYKTRYLRDLVGEARNLVPSAEASESERDHGLSRPSEYLRQRCPLCFGGLRDGATP